MRIKIYYLSGSIGVIETTALAHAEGVLTDDCYMCANDLLSGILSLQRSCLTEVDGDKRAPLGRDGTMTLCGSKELEGVGLVTVDGEPFAVHLADGRWAFPGIDAIANVRAAYQRRGPASPQVA